MHRVFLGSSVLVFISVLSGCAADPPPAPVAIDSPPVAVKPAETCRGDDCFVRGQELAKQQNYSDARVVFAHGCVGDGATMRNCSALAILLAKGQGGEPDEQRAFALANQSCLSGEGSGCWVHGVLERDALNDLAQADADFEKACNLGSAPGCEARETVRENPTSAAAPSSATASTSSGMNLTVNDMTVDGFTISKLECRLDNGAGLFGALAIGKTLSTRGDAMKRCTAHPTDITVHWKSRGASATNIRVASSDAKVNTCVERALANTPSPIPGQCTAHVTLTP